MLLEYELQECVQSIDRPAQGHLTTGGSRRSSRRNCRAKATPGNEAPGRRRGQEDDRRLGGGVGWAAEYQYRNHLLLVFFVVDDW